MAATYTVISIGALSRNRIWGERQPSRAAHATTTLVRDGTTTILVDPALPAELLAHRLDERAGLKLDQVEVVFLTTFRPAHRRALGALGGATWLMHEPEIVGMQDYLSEMVQRAAPDGEFTDPGEGRDEDTAEVVRGLEADQALLARVRAADDKLSRQVHLFPAAGASPGSAALLLAAPLRTVLIAGDAILTRDHAEAGQVFEHAYSVEDAQSALREILEVADEVVPGHDNVFFPIGR